MAAPTYDNSTQSTASGSQTTTLPFSFSHTTGAGANNGAIVAVVDTENGSGGFTPTGTPTCDIGGTALTYKGSITMGNVVAAGFITVWSGLLVPSGAQTVTASINGGSGQNVGNAFCIAFTYLGVGGFGSLQTAQGISSVPSLSATSAVGDLLWGIISNYGGASYSSPSLAQRIGQNASAPTYTAGDGAGASSVTVNATQAGGFHWAVAALDIQPAIVAVHNTNVNQAVQASLR